MTLDELRRAVSVARTHDAAAKRRLDALIANVESRRVLHDDYLVDVESDAQGVWMHRECASAIRKALREALA